MHVCSYLKSEVVGTNLYDLDLEEFNTSNIQSSSSILFYGYKLLEKKGLKSIPGKLSKYLNVTMPTEFTQEEFVHDSNMIFDEIYGICKYSCKWLNSLEGSNRYKYTFYPVSVPTHLKPFCEKKYDVIYHGGIHSEKYMRMLDVMKKYNYRYATMSRGINLPTQYALGKYATNVDLSPINKYKLLNSCKVSIAFNNFPVNSIQIKNIKMKPRWNNNEAFKNIDCGLVPQFKSRVNEAAALGVINLIEKDSWNIVEDFYEPDKDFVYFTDMNDLDEKIQDICENFDNYLNIRKSAYKKSLRYTRENLYSNINESISWRDNLPVN